MIVGTRAEPARRALPIAALAGPVAVAEHEALISVAGAEVPVFSPSALPILAVPVVVAVTIALFIIVSKIAVLSHALSPSSLVERFAAARTNESGFQMR